MESLPAVWQHLWLHLQLTPQKISTPMLKPTTFQLNFLLSLKLL
nr:MAG TPA: hypothetical protein [Caudoviricetes sp.]